jgi:predicted transcriptional regulator
MSDDVLGLTAQIVSAHVKRNAVPVEELSALIRDVHKTLAGLSEPTTASAPAQGAAPAVQVTKSVFPDYVICLECGKKMTMLKRHLMTEHSMTVDQYRGKFGLPGNYPMVAPNYATTRSNLAKEMGLGKSRTVAGRKAGRKAAGRRAKA